MKIKCRNNEYDLNEKDEILYNGNCYQILTRSAGSGWNTYTPIIAMNKAKKLIKEGKIVFKEKREFSFGKELDIYKISEVQDDK